MLNLVNKILGGVVIFIVKTYQFVISPLLGPTCRHSPTCSSYMIEAINEWGVFKGVWLGIKRVGKCHPWGTSGYDPVPKKESEAESKENQT
jgi:uncharacterized protein